MFYEKTENDCTIRVRVTPNSSKCGVIGIFTDSNGQDFIKIALTSVPEKGKANQELIKFLSKLLHLGKSNFTLLTGKTDHYKKILITPSSNISVTEIINCLEDLL